MRVSRRMVKPLRFLLLVCLLTVWPMGNSAFTPRVFAADEDENPREEALTAVLTFPVFGVVESLKRFTVERMRPIYCFCFSL